MSVPLFLVDELPTTDACRLDGPEGHHAATVQRLKPGEELLLADGRGGIRAAVVEAALKGALDLRLGERRHVPADDPTLTVVQGVAKGDRGELAVQLLTEVGVDAVVPWQAARSVARWKDARPVERWRATAREAAKQARRAWLPEVADAASTRQVAARLSSASTALVLHEEATVPLSGVELPSHGGIVLVVGPEGGIAPEELAVFAEAGAVPVRLGRSVLRTSTAGAAAVAVLSARLGRW